MSSLKKTLKYYFKEIKVVASRSRASIKETSTVNDISLLLSVVFFFPFTLSAHSHVPFLFFLAFSSTYHFLMPPHLELFLLPAWSTRSVPKYSLTRQVKSLL